MTSGLNFKLLWSNQDRANVKTLQSNIDERLQRCVPARCVRWITSDHDHLTGQRTEAGYCNKLQIP